MAQFSRALLIGLMAGAWAFIAPKIGLPTWPGFIGWSFYFVAGATPAALYKAGLPLLAGVLLGFGAFFAMGFLGTWAPLSVVAIATIMMLLGDHPLFAVIPAQFAGAASFFGVLNYVLSTDGNAAGALVEVTGALACGLVIGIISIVVPDMILGKPAPAES
jgi:hypothetical protein